MVLVAKVDGGGAEHSEIDGSVEAGGGVGGPVVLVADDRHHRLHDLVHTLEILNRNLKPEIRNLKPESRDPRPETLNPNPETLSPRPVVLVANDCHHRLHDLVQNMNPVP